MISQNLLYPNNPVIAPETLTQATGAFRKQVVKVMGTIVLFLIVYLFLFALSIALVIGCCYAGIAIMSVKINVLTIFGGLGLIGLAVMVFVFLVKFLFAVSKYDQSGIVEITEEEQPLLFAFIRRLTNDTQTPFPQKIYLSTDVNACVFYNSSFWSMFLPIKKNLQIGLGLVNALNVSEFKAVMAHEFGHFSQRSMKLGSFVYNVNKIIHNMLYENRGYGNFLQNWSSIHGIFSIFAGFTAKIAEGIQWVLRQMYGLINKSYMQLSKEMEFHADAVAASVTGSKSLITALRRLELANSGYTIALQKCDELFLQKKISNNIYHNQTAVLRQLADEYKLPIQQGLPVVNDTFLKGNNLARVNYKDQWASHPTTEDRELHLNQWGILAEEITSTAWLLFANKETLEAKLTKKIYENVEMPQDVATIDSFEFEEKLKNDIKIFSLPDEYNGFYDNRTIAINDNIELDVAQTMSFEEIFSVENASLQKRIIAATNDLEIVKAIADRRIATKTFDFDGVKFNRKDAAQVIIKLDVAIKEMQQQLDDLDKAAMQFFYDKGAQKSSSEFEMLKQLYHSYFQYRRKSEEHLKSINEMMGALQPLFHGQTMQIEDINVMISSLKNNYEPVFKKSLSEWVDVAAFENDAELMKRTKAFIESDYSYFSGESFFDNELTELNAICNDSWMAINNFIFVKFKFILEEQLRFKDY